MMCSLGQLASNVLGFIHLHLYRVAEYLFKESTTFPHLNDNKQVLLRNTCSGHISFKSKFVANGWYHSEIDVMTTAAVVVNGFAGSTRRLVMK